MNSPISKNKITLFPSILKVDGKEGTYFLDLRLWDRYIATLSVLHVHLNEVLKDKMDISFIICIALVILKSIFEGN